MYVLVSIATLNSYERRKRFYKRGGHFMYEFWTEVFLPSAEVHVKWFMMYRRIFLRGELEENCSLLIVFSIIGC